MTHVCPCCGAQVANPIAVGGIARDLPPVQAAILRALAANFGSFTPTARIAQIVWDRDPTGGPDGTRVSICQAVKRMKPKLREHGFIVEAEKWLGYRVRAA